MQFTRWSQLSLIEQMANIGSEVDRAIQWRHNKNTEYAQLANIRALELFDLTLADCRHGSGVKEIARARELWLDFFIGKNQYHQTDRLWRQYFLAFATASRLDR